MTALAHAAPTTPGLASQRRDRQPAPTPGPQPRELALPSVEQGLRYAWAYWTSMLGTLLRTNRLQPGEAGCYRTRFTLSRRLRDRWGRLFGLRLSDRVPLLHSQGAGTLLYTRIFADLGINSRHLLHLRHRTVHPAGEAALAHADEQQIESRLLRTVRVGRAEALVMLESRVTDAFGRLVAVVEDSFLVRRLPVAEVIQADNDAPVRRMMLKLLRRRCELEAGFGGARSRAVFVAPDAGRRYGEVSGDVNPAHRTSLGARLFGFRRPFVQGMYLRNLVTRELAEWGVDIDALDITFVGKAYLGQTLQLVCLGGRFELSNARGSLIAFGTV